MTYSLLALLLLPAAGPASTDVPVQFNRDVRPILADNCFACHGFDAKARKAKLRLDISEGAFAVTKGGTIPIKPGDPQASAVWSRINAEDPEEVMPPPHTRKKLTAAQKETIRRWIAQGAPYQKHWSFEPINRSAVPAVEGARTPLDAFLLDGIRRAGLTPRPEADRPALIRRVSFALTGLPPAVKEVDAFLADASPNAYERMVNRYLASPHFGEEMARHWLDMARYADTHGLHLDNERQMWAYRDWVVKAFNDNLPFDEFTVWQLAGDLLPNPTPDQLIATGFIRCGVTTSEGGAIEAEWVYRNAVDRTSTAAQTWMGLTAGCAVCHDHKFDPLSMREYYSLYAFFLSSADPALDGNVNNTRPFLKLPTSAQRAALNSATQAEKGARQRLEEAGARAAYIDPAEAASTSDARAVTDIFFDDAFPLEANASNTSRNATDWVMDPAFGAHSGRRVLRQANAFFHQDEIKPRLRPYVVPAHGRFTAWVRLDPLHPPTALALKVNKGPKAWWGEESPAQVPEIGYERGTRKGPLPAPGKWVQLSVAAADLGLKEGQRVSILTLQEYGGIAYWDTVALRGESRPATDPLASFRVWWKGLGGKAPPGLPAGLGSVVAAGPAKPQPAEAVAKLRTFYLAYIARPVTDELAVRQAEWEKTRADREAAEAAIPGTMTFADRATPRNAFVMTRGQYDRPGEKVEPAVPAVLPPLRNARRDTRPTRLDLANWLVNRDHPLTARVAVNRLWQQFFGTGLVRTSSDFGTQGEPPSHPELLDWLAAEYRDGGWDTKRFVKMLVMSDAFRRDSRQTAAEQAKDPQNRLLARGPRFRLAAEQIRDNALFASGLIDRTMGGRGVRPYQPANIWEPVGYSDSNTRYYLQDHGSALYRRSLYVFLKRTAPHPFLVNFDAPNREQLCAVRDRTNTPLQALQLMNDVQHVEAARALAERALAEGGSTTDERITFLYRTLLSRRPAGDELRLVSANLAQQRKLYRADPAAARKLVASGESKPRGVAPADETAAWTMVANLLLNLDETLNRN